LKSIDNLEIHEKENIVLVSVNPKIFPLQVVYSAAFVSMEKAYVIIDGNPEMEIVVTLRPKEGRNPEELGRKFTEELVNYSVSMVESQRTMELRKVLIEKALLGHKGKK